VRKPGRIPGGDAPVPALARGALLLARAGTPVFVAGLAAWIIGFITLCLFRRRVAPGILIGAGLASSISYWLTAVAYPGPYGHAGSFGALLAGLIPLACLVVLGGDLPIPARSLRRCLVPAALLAAVLIAAGDAAANPYPIAGRTTAPALLAGLWATGITAALIAGWRWPGAAVAGAVLNLPVLLIRAGNAFCCSPPPIGPELVRPAPPPGPFAVQRALPASGQHWVLAWLAAEVALLAVAVAGRRRGEAQ